MPDKISMIFILSLVFIGLLIVGFLWPKEKKLPKFGKGIIIIRYVDNFDRVEVESIGGGGGGTTDAETAEKIRRESTSHCEAKPGESCILTLNKGGGAGYPDQTYENGYGSTSAVRAMDGGSMPYPGDKAGGAGPYQPTLIKK